MRAPHAIGTRLPAALAGSLGSFMLAACTAVPVAAADAAPVHAERILVKVVVESTGDDIARRAASVAGVPVRYAAASGGSWHALILECRDAAQCSAAVARLRGASQSFAAVEPDGRRRAQ